MRRRSAVVLGIGLLLVACGAEHKGDAKSVAAEALAGTSWAIVEIDGAAIPDAKDGPPAELVFLEEARFAGSAGCNRILGAAVQDGGKLTLTPGPMTMMACPEPLGSRETSLVKALGAVTGHRRSGDALELLAGDRVVVRLVRKTNAP